jgi:hypothetical protein
MRPIPILLALVVVLGFVSEAEAFASYINRDRSIEVGKYRFGFSDWSPGSHGGSPYSVMHAGPFGEWQVSFTATQGVFYFRLCAAGMVTLLALLTVLTFRWKRKRVA